MSGKYTLVIHGGAGAILKKNMTPEKEQMYHAKLKEALGAGNKVLKEGGTATDAVIASIKIMEDSPLFNAGKGAVFTNAGTNEMDASIMEGKEMNAGAVAGATTIKNPIEGAKAVMQNSPHVMLAGKGADDFAKKQGLAIEKPEYFKDEIRYKQWEKVKGQEKIQLDHDGDEKGYVPDSSEIEFNINIDSKYGTVGAVALDQYGNLAAGTSTGGMTNKRWGRIGDSPIIGAGTYADNRTCAISCTGHGEYFIRLAVAKEISALMQHKGLSVKEASENVIHNQLEKIGGKGGVIGVDANGNIAMTFNTPGMYRGFINYKGETETAIYKQE